MSWQTFTAPVLPGMFTPEVEASPALPRAERKRLSRQNAAILERLKAGPATNDELAKISRKYTSRISDVRKAGYNVQLIEHDHASGLTRYALVPR